MENKHDRLTEFIKLCGLNQSAFALAIGISDASLSSAVLGKTFLKLETIEKIVEKFDLNVNWLINGIGNPKIQKETENGFGDGEKIRAVVLSADQEKEKISYLPASCIAGFIQEYPNGEYYKFTTHFSLPGYNNGSAIAMRVEGDSMYPTLRNEDIVVAEPVMDKEYFESKEIYIIFHKNMRPLIKRAILDKDKKALVYLSDNMDYNDGTISSRTLLLKDIQFLFQFKKRISGASEMPADVNKYLNMIDNLMKQNLGLVDQNNMLIRHQLGIVQAIPL